MSNETDNKGYRKPEHGDEDWHVPLNDNFDRIDRDVHDIERRLENGSGDGTTARFEEFVHGSTHAPVEGSIVEDHRSGSLDHWRGNTDPFDVITGDTIAGEYSVHLEHPGGESSDAYHLGTESATTRRGEVYSCFVRFDRIDERNQAGLTVCGEWDDDGIVRGYLARLKEDGDLQILKWDDGFEGTSDSVNIDVETGVRYRIEIELGWDDTTARVFSAEDDELGSTTWEGETGLTAGGVGYGGRWANGSDGEAVTFDHITRKSLDATPARIAGSGVSGPVGNGGGDVDTTGVEDWDVLLRQLPGGSYEAINNEGDAVVSTANAPDALNDAVDATPTGGTLVCKGHYPFANGEEWHIEKDVRLLGHGATLETFYEEDEFFIYMRGERTGSYDVNGITKGEDSDSSRPILHLDSDVDGTIEAGDVVMLESDEEYPGYPGGPGTQEKGEGYMVGATSTDESNANGGDIWDGLGDDEISLMEVLELDYDTSYDVEITHYRPIEVHFEGFDLLGPDVWNPKVGGIAAIGTAECTFRELHFREIGYECLRLVATYDITVDNCTFAYGASNHDGGDGYGVVCKGGTAHTYIHNSSFHMMRHGIATGGSGYVGKNRREMVVDSCVFTYNRSTALDNHGEDLSLRVTNCHFALGNDSAISFGGRRTIIEGNYFNMGLDDDAIYDNGGQPNRSTVIANNLFYRAKAGIDFQREDSYHKSVNINGNEFHQCENSIECRSAIEMLSITGNTFSSMEDDSIRFEDHRDWNDEPGNEHGVHAALISNNTFTDDSGDNCIQWRYRDRGGGKPTADNVVITNNVAKNCETFVGGTGDSENCVVKNNHLIDVDDLIDFSGGSQSGWVVESNTSN